MPLSPRLPRSHGLRQQSGGFALLLTIVLVSFLVLILVGLAVFTRVETSVAGNAQKVNLARQNALVGLNLAVGHLQKYAGPDQRLTARSDIDSAYPDTFFTGVWDRSGNLQTWLVSGNELATGTPTDIDPNTVIPAADAVYLVGDNSADNAPVDQRVQVPKVPIEIAADAIPGLVGAAPTTIGHYAYWVGDEGVKVSASLINPTISGALPVYNDVGVQDWSGATSDDRDRLDQQMLARPRTDHIFTPAELDPDAGAFLTYLPRVLNRDQLRFFSNNIDAPELKEQFHNITPLSLSVPVDIIDGRLRVDVTDPDDTPNESPAVPALPANVGAFIKYRATPIGLGSYDWGYAMQATPLELAPVITEFSIQFGFYRYQYIDATPTTHVEAYIGYQVKLEMWNPYAATWVYNHRAGDTNPTFYLKMEGLPQNLEIAGSAGYSRMADLDANVPLIELVAPPLVPVTMAPGQIVQLTSSTNTTNGAWYFQVPAFDDPSATNLTALQASMGGNFQVRLMYDPDGADPIAPQSVAVYTPGPGGFAATADVVSTDISPLPGAGFPFVGVPHFGYGFQLDDTLSRWTFDDGSGKPADPRNATLYDTSFWTLNPDLNTSTSTASSTNLNVGNTVVLYDLPRQQVVSLGMLTHLPEATSTASYRLGNVWGGGFNTYFDRYFFSTVPQAGGVWDPASPGPLPNRYIQVYQPEGATPALTDLQDADAAARYLLIKGAFNINSTSIDAWEAVLGSKLSGANTWDNSGGSTNLDNVFFRFPHGAQQDGLNAPPTGQPATVLSAQTGGRQVTDVEIRSLAEQIVALIKAKGRPFDSLAEFINDGVIHQAIRAAVPAINPTAAYEGTPASLSQADVIGAIAPFITPRSDTFLIRTYGDVVNPVTGNVEASTWCEAVVQRVPDLVYDQSAGGPPPLADIIAADPAPTKYPYGRKFKIVSLRWLTPDDI